MIDFFGCKRDGEYNPYWTVNADKIIRSGIYLQGPCVAALESAFADRFHGRHAVAVGSCTDALFFSLKDVIEPGGEVLVPDVSFLATASAVVRAGGTPVFVDVDPNTMLMDLDEADRLVSRSTQAIILVHLYGSMSYDEQRLKPLLARIPICIEDCAQAFGSYDGRVQAGMIGDYACFSFDPTKPVGGPGSGGMVLTDSANAARIRMLRYHGKPDCAQLGYNSQMSEICASVVLDKIYNKQWDWRAQVVEYRKLLSDVPEVSLLAEVGTPAYSKFVIKVSARDALATSLRAKGIETRVHYPHPLHSEPLFNLLPTGKPWWSTRACNEILSLPLYRYLTLGEIRYVVQCIKEFYYGNS